MAEHKVTVQAPELELGRADVIFKVYQDKKVVGTLKLSKGSLHWIPRDKTYGHEMKWKEFAELIEGYFKAREGSK